MYAIIAPSKPVNKTKKVHLWPETCLTDVEQLVQIQAIQR